VERACEIARIGTATSIPQIRSQKKLIASWQQRSVAR
jgi:hypothetical protein